MSCLLWRLRCDFASRGCTCCVFGGAFTQSAWSSFILKINMQVRILSLTTWLIKRRPKRLPVAFGQEKNSILIIKSVSSLSQNKQFKHLGGWLWYQVIKKIKAYLLRLGHKEDAPEPSSCVRCSSFLWLRRQAENLLWWFWAFCCCCFFFFLISFLTSAQNLSLLLW